jgi:hypothetical protein
VPTVVVIECNFWDHMLQLGAAGVMPRYHRTFNSIGSVYAYVHEGQVGLPETMQSLSRLG